MIKKLKSYANKGVAMAKTGLGIGVAASVGSSFGVDTGASKMSKALPIAGSIMATKMVADSVNELVPKKYRRKV